MIDAEIPLGGRRRLPISFDVPQTDRRLFLELEVRKPGQGLLYRDASTVYAVEPLSTSLQRPG